MANFGTYGDKILRGFGNRQWGAGCKQALTAAFCTVWNPRNWQITNDLNTVIPNAAIDDPQARYNQTMLLYTGQVYGREGTDYQNPYLFLANMFVTKAELAPAFSTRMQTPEEVSANIIASSSAFNKLPAGRLH